MIFFFLFLFFENCLNHTGRRLNSILFAYVHHKDYGKWERSEKTSLSVCMVLFWG